MRRFTLGVFLTILFASTVQAAEVRSGDSFFSILSDIFAPSEILDISKQVKASIPGFVLKQGTEYTKEDERVIFKIAYDTEIEITKDTESFGVNVREFPHERVRDIVQGTITSNLFDAVERAGEDAELAIRLASIFEWEIDFFRDLRPGDSFTIMVEKVFVQNRFVGYGKILADDFINRGRLSRALYYEDEETRGYFTPDGLSLRRGFLRAPIKYGRITSRFTNSRFHPVLQTFRSHPAIDYGAPIGTPVMTTADGVIVKMSYSKSNGNYVKIRHSNNYHTFYLHLNGFRKGLKTGSRVRQGDVIAYVGNTGYSTGSHLDYRIMKGKTYLNPLSFVSPVVRLPKKKMYQFGRTTEAIAFQLENAYTTTASRTGLTLIR